MARIAYIDPMIADRLAALRAQLQKQRLDGFIVPHADEYQNEYLPPSAERLSYITGFTGSAGIAIVMVDGAALFVDGRYTIQAAAETPAGIFTHFHLANEPPEDWLKAHVSAGQRIGYDPWLHTVRQVRKLSAATAAVGAKLVVVKRNPVDAVWKDRPRPPASAIVTQPLEYAGQSAEAKRAEIGAILSGAGQHAAVLTDPASIAWLLNIRGSDVPCTPLALSFAIVHATGNVDWFVDAARIAEKPGRGVTLRAPAFFNEALGTLGGFAIRLDPSGAPDAIAGALRAAGARIVEANDPCQLPQACKNGAEQEGARAAHRRDGAALCNFLGWFDTAKGPQDEMAVAAKLESFRARSNLYRGASFETIAAAGPNGAIVHYHATEKTNRRLARNNFLLLDSGAQYLDGTTDVTRTIPVGTPTREMREMFTLVLKGHIAIATARFPRGTTGQQLDVLARQFLWRNDANYDHGTGHGVGSFLSVHEGPQRISPKAEAVPLEPGMIVSNEPGYYEAGKYGIRIENLVMVTDGEAYLGFETLTLAPIDRRCIDRQRMTAEEIDWLDRYHKRVWTAISGQVDGAARDWLKQATLPL